MTGPPKHRDRKGAHRTDRLLRELVHDPYKSKSKLGLSVCSGCGAVYLDGRWSWESAPSEAPETTCPACHRIRDEFPAGFLTLSGDFLTEHREEITNLIRNIETREKSEHPMKRIIGLEEGDGKLVATFTDPHLARSAGEGIARAYGGELHFEYQKGEYLLRVTWSR